MWYKISFVDKFNVVYVGGGISYEVALANLSVVSVGKMPAENELTVKTTLYNPWLE